MMIKNLLLAGGVSTLVHAVQVTNSDYDIIAGEPFTIEWADAEGGVTIRLKSGPSDNLETVQEITSKFISMSLRNNHQA